MRNWISDTDMNLHIKLFSGKSTITVATRAGLFDSSMHQIVCRLGLRPRPH